LLYLKGIALSPVAIALTKKAVAIYSKGISDLLRAMGYARRGAGIAHTCKLMAIFKRVFCFLGLTSLHGSNLT